MVLGVLVLGGVWLVTINNELQQLNEEIDQKWVSVAAVHKERTDLIPNLVTNAREFAEFEEETLNKLIGAHQDVQDTPMAVMKRPPLDLEWFQLQQNKVSSSFLEVQHVVSKYPYLASYPEFETALQRLDTITRSIQLERASFNEQVGTYNMELIGFPNQWVAKLFGHEERAFFEPE